MSISKHDKATAEAIFNMIDWQESVIIRDDGVYLNEDFRAYSPPDSVFDWTPAYDMDWEGAPNPITAPVLPIPFTINELAACMLDGPGSGIHHALDSRIGYPLNEEALSGFSLRHRKVAEAIREAYACASEAQNPVGEYDHDAEQKAHEQLHQFDEANDLANKREGVFESGITPEEADERRARARASVAELKKRAQEAKFEAETKWRAWRKAMVIQLLGRQATQPDQIAQKLLESQSEQFMQMEALHEAAVSRLLDASNALERRRDLLATPQSHGGLAELERLEATVSAKQKEVEDAQHALRVMRGDFLEFDSSNDSKNEATALNEQHETEFAIAFYGACLDLDHWTGLNAVQPLEAAMLLNNENPLSDLAHSGSVEIQKLLRVFEDHAAIHPARRTLLDWIHVAQERKTRHDTAVEEAVLAITRAVETATESTKHTTTLMGDPGTPGSQKLELGTQTSSPVQMLTSKGSQPALSPEQKAEIGSLFQQGVSVNQLSKKYPASRRTIDEALKEAGLKAHVTPRKQKKGAKFPVARPLESRMK